MGEVEVVRYRCKAWRKTFTVRPEGATRSSKSLRVQGLALIMWVLGLSYDSVVAILGGLGVPLGKGTACGYVLRAGAGARSLRAKAARGKIRFAGMDTTVFKVKGRKVIAAFVTDALADLVERGEKLFSHNRHRGESGRYRLDGTYNVTERAIGLDGKWRYRSMRGAKSRRALGNVLNLQAYIRQRTLAGDGPLDVSRLLAA